MFTVLILPSAIEDLRRLDPSVATRILDKIEWLAAGLPQISPIPLRGPLSGFFKLRIGDWRIIYDVDWGKESVAVHRIGHRSDIYL